MKKLPTNTILIVLGTTAFIILFLYAIIKIYDVTLNEAKKSHQFQQLEMAKAASIGIKTYLDHIQEDMWLLKSYEESFFKDQQFNINYINKFYNHYDQEAVNNIFITKFNHEIIYSIGDSLPDWVNMIVTQQTDSIIMANYLDSTWYSPVMANKFLEPEEGMSFLILLPLTLVEKDQKQLFGILGYLLNFNYLVEQFIEPVNLSKNDFAWIIDGNGRLIYHPRHTEMLHYSINDLSSDCMNCHRSFKMQKKMMIGSASISEYKIGDEPQKIMAYYPIHLQNEKWIFAISTLLPEVTKNLREKFKLFFILGIIILVAILIFGITLYFVNSRRIRAEESSRQAKQIQQFEQQLNQASKLASIGELVDTVAHEINTPAGIISAQADALLLQNKYDYTESEEIRVIKKQTKRISKYTRTLLGFSKRVAFYPKMNDVPEILEECFYLLGHKFRAKQITIRKNFAQNLPQIFVDRDQMEQVFINFLNNAADAIRENGKIRVSAKKFNKNNSKDKLQQIHGIQIEFADNGIGISQEALNQIFKPFFSTKPASEGTGLGLYISKSIIQRHRGTVEVVSTPHQGTQFIIFLPLNFKDIRQYE